MKFLAKPAALLALLSLGACASVVDGTTQNITVASEPEGAQCTLVRAGQTIAVANPAPQTFKIDKSKNDIVVTCVRPGHLTASETVSSVFTGATVGNILLGGLIGVAIDAASGANNRYPEYVLVLMTPERFNSAAERDAHFEKVKARVRSDADALIAKARTGCTVAKELCDQDVKKVEAAREQKLAEIEKRRQETAVGVALTAPPAPSAPVAAAPVAPPANPAQTEAKLANKTPVSFASVAERDNWVEYQKAQAARERDAATQNLRIECTKSGVAGSAWEMVCQRQIDEVLTKYNTEIARIEKLRSTVPVRAAT